MDPRLGMQGSHQDRGRRNVTKRREVIRGSRWGQVAYRVVDLKFHPDEKGAAGRVLSHAVE